MSKAERREPFEFNEVAIRSGTRVQIELPVARLPAGTMSTMPVLVVHGKRPGPTVWFNAALHGDELNGVEIVRRLLYTVDPKRLAGTVLGVPIVNVFGVTGGSRYLPDRRDLNRCFPGSSTGSLASRLAHLFFERIVCRCEVGIDFHTGSGGRSNLPQLRCDLDEPGTRELAEAFATPLVIHASLRDGSLRSAARKQGVRVLVYEAGEAGRFDQAAVVAGVDGSLRVLHHLSMIEEAPPAPAVPAAARVSKWMRASRSGFCQIEVELGQRVTAGETVAVIRSATGKTGSIVRTNMEGFVIGLLRQGVVHRGDAVVNIAEVSS